MVNLRSSRTFVPRHPNHEKWGARRWEVQKLEDNKVFVYGVGILEDIYHDNYVKELDISMPFEEDRETERLQGGFASQFVTTERPSKDEIQSEKSSEGSSLEEIPSPSPDIKSEPNADREDNKPADVVGNGGKSVFPCPYDLPRKRKRCVISGINILDNENRPEVKDEFGQWKQLSATGEFHAFVKILEQCSHGVQGPDSVMSHKPTVQTKRKFCLPKECLNKDLEYERWEADLGNDDVNGLFAFFSSEDFYEGKAENCGVTNFNCTSTI